MARILTVSRATVPPEHEAEYVRLVFALAALGPGRGQRLWVFRRRDRPGEYVEFSEGRSELAHRVRASRTDREVKLERRLREIARYADDAWDLWEEVPLPADLEPAAGAEETESGED